VIRHESLQRVEIAGAAVRTVNLIIVLAVIGDIKAYHAVFGHRLTAAQVSQVSHLNTLFITGAIVTRLVPIAVWLRPVAGTDEARRLTRPGDTPPGQHGLAGSGHMA
jgi:hypothetical protein